MIAMKIGLRGHDNVCYDWAGQLFELRRSGLCNIKGLSMVLVGRLWDRIGVGIITPKATEHRTSPMSRNRRAWFGNRAAPMLPNQRI
jgi:hypothetical protein